MAMVRISFANVRDWDSLSVLSGQQTVTLYCVSITLVCRLTADDDLHGVRLANGCSDDSLVS